MYVPFADFSMTKKMEYLKQALHRTGWEELPDDWVCPLCGAENQNLRNRVNLLQHARKTKPVIDTPSDMQELSPLRSAHFARILPAAVKSSINRKKQIYLKNWPVILNRYQRLLKIRISVGCLTLSKKTLRKVSQMQML